MDYKICIVTHDGEISDTIYFSGNNAHSADNLYYTDSMIHLDDSIRTIKMKLLYELHKGEHANKIQLRPSYEELYLYGYVSEDTTTLRLFDAVKAGQEEESDLTISRHLISQMIEGHPFANKIMEKLPDNEKIPYTVFESLLSEKEIKLSVKTPLGVLFEGGRRDTTFEPNPFFVDRFRAYLVEHNNIHYFDDSLLLTYGNLAERTIYVCLADRIYESASKESEEYISRYYFPGLYKNDVTTKETLAEKRGKLIKSTQALLTEDRMQYYRSINTFYEIAADMPLINYISNGITDVQLRLKNTSSHRANLEMLFKNIHCTKELPYIKFNPGNRRENLYRFYFERTTRTGKKIPYLSRAHIMRIAKETGRGQQISVYLEGVVLENNRLLSNCYIHFELDGDIQLQLVFRSPVGEHTVDNIIQSKIVPYLEKMGRDLLQTGYTIPSYRGLRDIANTKVVDMTYVSKAAATKNISWETVPCIYSICTLNKEMPGQPPVVRLKRVDNFREMDAANILIAELYGRVQYGELGLQDVVNELVSRGLSENEEIARTTVATFLSTVNEMDGNILENPGFPMNAVVDSEDNTIQLSVTGLTSIFYLDTIGVYTDAIVKMTQRYKNTHPLLTKLKKYCKKAEKFREVEQKPETKPVAEALQEATMVEMPVKFKRLTDEEDFFAQFASDEEDDVLGETEQIDVAETEEPEIDNLIDRLNMNKPKPSPLWFDETEEEERKENEPSPQKQPEDNTPKQLFFGFDSDESEQAESKTEKEQEESKTEKETTPPRRGNKPKQLFFGFDSDDEDETGGGPTTKIMKTTTEEPLKQVQFADPETLLAEQDIPNGEEDDDDNNEDADDKTRRVPNLKPVNPFLKKLRKKDPVLFMSKPTGKYKAYSVSCQPTSRHPVILTKEELDKTDKSAYNHAIKYGSDPNNPNYFICPRFWCFLTNSAISEDDVKNGKCGTVIPKNVENKDIPEGAYVYELNPNEQIPGFIEDARADGKCLPCCFKKKWDNKTQSDARKRCDVHMQVADVDADTEEPEVETKKKQKGRKPSAKTVQYIYSLDTYPVPANRWGFLPIPVQLFMQIDYRPDLDPNNPALLQPGKPTFLRCGVEQPLHQSFIGCFADIYSNRQGLDKVLPVDEFRKRLITAIDLDVFVEAHNGSLLSVFFPKNSTQKVSNEMRDKYKNTEFATGLDLSIKAMKQHLDDAILAYEQFLAYLSDTDAHIDHQYLWDFVCGDNRRITPGGLNLVILEIKANDIIDRVEIVCPTNLYSRNQYDATKDTVLLLKHDEFYEPIYLYEQKQNSTNVERFLVAKKLPSSIDDMLRRIEQAMGKYCPGMPSLPRIYQFANPVNIKRALGALVNRAKIEAQVVNYQGKTIGLMVRLDSEMELDSVYFPCAPSARLKKLPAEFMDEESIPKEYEHTVKILNKINRLTNLPCKPVWKIKEDGLVVGFLIETNQFVPIKPTEDIRMDGLQTYEGVGSFAADKTLATESRGDKKRIQMTKYIVLESQFYHAFRNRIRNLINQFANREFRNEIKKTTEDTTILYSTKIQLIERLIERLIKEYIVFVDIDKSTLLDIAEVNDCDAGYNDNEPYCIMKENGISQLVIPKWHLISNHDNEKIYIGRMADEFIRNDRVKSVMFDTANRLNSKTTDYSIREDEFILVQSALTRDYFSEMESIADTNPYVKNINYETANPSISVVYSNEKIPLSEQYNAPSDELVGVDQSCLVKVSKVVGNRQQIWTRIFSEDTREYILRDNTKCTYQPIIRVVKIHMGETWSVLDVKTRLSAAYERLFDADSLNIQKIANIMREQGKREMFERIVKDRANASPADFQSIVVSDNYHITDMDIWVIANEYDLPIIVFNPNGLKGFFSKQSGIDAQWVRMGGKKEDAYHFIRSKIGSFANRIYEYNLVVPETNLSNTKEFINVVIESERMNRINTAGLEDALKRFL